ncbi:MAG: DNA polymerase I [Spirochaetales bacterium]|nr:DNA polymerase I [Spirochaetales bacterium]
MSNKPEKLVLIDGMALAYRGHFALIRNPRFTTYSLNTSAIYVFANALVDIINSHEPTHFAVAFDTPEPTHRHKAYAQYKANRESMPEDLSKALPFILRLCEAFNIPVLRYPGWEADDVVGTLTRIADSEGLNTLMVTPDKDFAQLVSTTSIIGKPSSAGGLSILGMDEICNEWGIRHPDQVVDILGLMGDSSDNVPGVPGIGKKTAQKLIAAYDNLEGIYDHIEEMKGKQRENLEENRELAYLSRDLVRIVRTVPVTHSLDDLAWSGWNEEASIALFNELEFGSIGSRLFGDGYAESAEEAKKLSAAADIDHKYELVDTLSGVQSLCKEMLQQKALCFDLETTGLDEKICDIVGIAVSWRPSEGYFVLLPDDRRDAAPYLEALMPFFENTTIEKIGHNIKYDLSVLRWHGILVQGPFFDTMIAAYLCASQQQRRTMDALAEVFLKYQTVHIESLIGEKGSEQNSMREVPVEKLVEYAAEDADITLQLSHAFAPMIEEQNQHQVFYEIECPLIPVLVEMEHEGVKIDASVLQELSGTLGVDIEATAHQIEKLAGESFNLNSPKQLGEILFDKLQLDPHAKRTKKTGQYITNERVLTRLASRHEIVQKILDYRMRTKLKSTYVDMLPQAVFAQTGRIHTSYEQAVTATGRMQSHDPNLQNIPIRTDLGREIRGAFVADGSDRLLLAADYSQIELRIAAALSKEPALMKAFEDRVDIHTATAMGLFGVEMAGVTAEMRRHAKTVNFGILYGISAFGLSDRSELSRGEAAAIIRDYFIQYPNLKRWQGEIIEFAHSKGYVETATGRRRYLRDINSRNATVRSAAERNAINSPVQGTAADLIKRAMVIIQNKLDKEGLQSKMLLQVHDELVFEVYEAEKDIVAQIVNDGMVNALPMGVPIVVEMGTAKSWLEAH